MRLACLFLSALLLLAACGQATSVFPPTATPPNPTAPATIDLPASPSPGVTTVPPTRTAGPPQSPTPPGLENPTSPLSKLPAELERRDLAVITPANLASLELLVAFRPGPVASISRLHFFPDHNRLAFALASTAGDSPRSTPIYLWNLASAIPDQILDSGYSDLQALVVSADGVRVAATGNGPLRVWDASRGQLIDSPPEREALPLTLAYASQGWLAFGYRGEGSLATWQPGQPAETWRVPAQALEISALAVDHRGERIASAGLDGTLWLWKAASGDDDKQVSSQGGVITSLAFTPNDQELYAYDKSGALRGWRLSDVREILAVQVCSSGLPGCPAVAFSPDRRLLALADPAQQDGAGVRLYRLQDGAFRHHLAADPAIQPGLISALAFSPDSRLLAVGSSDGQIQLWGIPGGLFEVDAILRVTEAGDGLNLRDRPALGGSIRSQLSEGDSLTLREGPLLAEGYNWWRAITGDGREGWIAEVTEWFEKGE